MQPSSENGPGGRDWFVYQLEPGEVYGDIVGVSNLSERPVRFLIYTKDAFNVPDLGEFAAQEDQKAPEDIGTWIDLATSEIVIEPGTRADIPFSITVPQDAEPGDHAGAILAIDADDAVVDTESGDGLGFNVRQRIGARVYVRVAGPIDPSMAVERLEVEVDEPVLPFVSGGGTATINWDVRNTGNIRLNGTLEIAVKGLFGRTIKTLDPIELPQLLPGGNFVGTATVHGMPPLERLTVEATVTAEEDLRVTRATPFWVVNWLLVLALVGMAGGLWWRHRRRHRPDAPVPAAQPSDALEEVLV